MERFVCPICFNDTTCTKVPNETYPDYSHIRCETCEMQFNVSNSILSLGEPTLRYQLFNLIYEILLRQPFKEVNGTSYKWCFYYDAGQDAPQPEVGYHVNLATEMKKYPANLIERIERALLNLSIINEEIGLYIRYGFYLGRLLFCTSFGQEDEINEMLSFMVGLGYLDGDARRANYKVSFHGWEKIIELKKSMIESNQGFIAMSYSPKVDEIYRTFCSAIDACGYKPFAMKMKEHNNQVVPEMFFEIERSKFMVVDVTHANLGAYYEAGYAQALGKEVIVCCEKTALESDKKSEQPHFDIAQKCMVVWETPEELKEKLITRIRATVH